MAVGIPHCAGALAVEMILRRHLQRRAGCHRLREQGERSGAVRDPYGHRWLIGHSIEDVQPEEMQRRYDKLFT